MDLSHLAPKLTDWIPHTPTAKQLAFLMLPQKEAFYGGAAGGGKSDALLMAALQYVDVPGYAAMILRKTLADLKMPGALIDRAHSWLGGTDARWMPGEHAYYFPTIHPITGEPAEPAKLVFGYIGESSAYLRYQGIELQYCAYDELTQHNEGDFTYLFSRLRKNICSVHPETDQQGNPAYYDDCQLCQQQKNLPVRMRAASNPGGPGHEWVKKRYKIQKDKKVPADKARFIGTDPKRPYIPAFIRDNPFIAQKEYEEGLQELDDVTKGQLLAGNWDVSPSARFKRRWIKYYSRRGTYYCFGLDGRGESISPSSLQRVFTTVDPAASAREGPGDMEIWKGPPSHTVISTWGLTQDYNLLWLDMHRGRWEVPDVIDYIIEAYRKWRPAYVCIEATGLGIGVFQAVSRRGVPTKPIRKHHDKLTNATDAQERMKQGKIWLPQSAPWLEDAESEIFIWTGHPHEADDIIDTLADAAKDVSWEAAGSADHMVEENPLGEDDLPGIIPMSSDSGSGSQFSPLNPGGLR